jgi:chromosome partitioning protein
MGHVLAVVNQKGGVGKTTTAVNLGAALAAAGHRALVVDCDPQCNATRSLGLPSDLERTVYDALTPHDTRPLGEVVAATSWPGLAVAPASPSLAGLEVELVGTPGREGRLKQALAALQADFDFVLLDCPPSLGLLSVNALVAADGVIVPVQCEYLSLEGLGQLTRTLELVRARMNPSLRLVGLVMTMYDPRTNLSLQVVQEVARHFPRERFHAVIPRSVRLSEAPSYGETVLAYAPGSAGAQAYQALAAELVERLPVGAARGVA